MRRPGRLISLEGVTGAGKSTALRRLRAEFPGSFATVGGYGSKARVATPFHRDLLQCIRKQLNRDEFLRLDWSVECLVLQAELLLAEATLVLPALAAGSTVLYEHHQASILAYQAARLVEEKVRSGPGSAVQLVARGLRGFTVKREPDVVVFFDVPSRVAAKRAAIRDGRKLSSAAARFNDLVGEAYRSALSRHRRIVRVADGDEAVEAFRSILQR